MRTHVGSFRSPDLHRVESGLGAADALHRGDGGSVELAQRQQAGVDRVMSDGEGGTATLDYTTSTTGSTGTLTGT